MCDARCSQRKKNNYGDHPEVNATTTTKRKWQEKRVHSFDFVFSFTYFLCVFSSLFSTISESSLAHQPAFVVSRASVASVLFGLETKIGFFPHIDGQSILLIQVRILRCCTVLWHGPQIIWKIESVHTTKSPKASRMKWCCFVWNSSDFLVCLFSNETM